MLLGETGSLSKKLIFHLRTKKQTGRQKEEGLTLFAVQTAFGYVVSISAQRTVIEK